MKKSVYSLVLSDDVVALADRAAARKGISRSAYINEVLARDLAHVTPQMRIRQIFEDLEKIADNTALRVMSPPSDAMMSLLGSLAYKYNPTVRYSVELTHKTEGVIGALKVSFRTQSESFTHTLSEFFYLVSGLENTCAPQGVSYKTESGRVTRYLAVPPGKHYSAQETSLAISEYIQMFDRALNAYFSQMPNTEKAARSAAEVYSVYRRKAKYLI